jgi:hypothetical protein
MGKVKEYIKCERCKSISFTEKELRIMRALVLSMNRVCPHLNKDGVGVIIAKVEAMLK